MPTPDSPTSLGKTAAQITAHFALVPALGPAADLICGVLQLCQQVPQNKNALSYLLDQCHCLGLVVYDQVVNGNPPITKEVKATVIDSLTRCLQQIHDKMQGWMSMNRIEGFLHQDGVAEDIERILADCLDLVSHISNSEMRNWRGQYRLAVAKDFQELVAYLVNIENSQSITNDVLQLMASNLRTANQQPNGLSSNLYDLQLKSCQLLPDFHLRSGEVIRIGQFPVSGTSNIDIYEGLYLGREKIAIKVVRAVNSNENSMRRFKRECDIWKKLWAIDHGEHILPFYGFCQDDGPFPYMVSPWQANGTALTYVKANDKIDHWKLVKQIALGVQVLHGMNPHVVHGDLRASNIAISAAGNPLIMDFGLSRIVEDITGIPLSQSQGLDDSYRWFAPEVCIGQGDLSLASDVYAYGMTVLEIFTHEQPYSNIKHTTEVVIRSVKGERPMRPTDVEVVTRGLDDKLWALLALCWSTEPTRRPTIQQVLGLFGTKESISDLGNSGSLNDSPSIYCTQTPC
ncbi:kinase-like domain-containing protein [Mycena sanguinolenta]|nr:kinase-like domain-containing protein [Mycena sanguinolenta]